jgi:excisionase family DNA binding protein
VRELFCIAIGCRAVPPPKCKLTDEEIQRAFAGTAGEVIPPVLSPNQLAQLLGLKVKTIYEWISKGRLDGTFRKRGKHVLIWRDRAVETIFAGKEWTTNE